MKKLLMILMIGMFLITLVSSTSTNYVAEYYTPVEIVETCTLIGFPCDNTYECNITIINPNEDVVIRDEPMTRNFPTYNYTFTNTSDLGYYKIYVYCSNGVFGGYDEDIILQVTTTGRTPEIKVAIFMLVISLIAFILALYLKSHSIGFISGILLMMAGIYQMVYGFGDVANLYTQATAYIVLAFGLFVMLISGIEWLEDSGG